MNNLIQEGSYGIDLSFTNNSICVASTHTIISNNEVWNNYYVGISVQYAYSLHIFKNDITSNDENTSYYGIYLNNNDSGIKVIRNYVHDVKNYSLYLVSSNNSSVNRGLIANNFLQSRDNGNGVYMSSDTYLDIFHNSVHKSNNTNTGNYAFQLEYGSNNRVWDNIFANSGGGPAIMYYSPANQSSDYNDFYSTSCNLGRYTNTYPADLAEWQAVTGDDAHSLEVNPAFVNDTDLHSISAILDGAGVQYRNNY